MRLATTSLFSDMLFKLKEKIISHEHTSLKNSNWLEADQLAILNIHDRGVELGSTEKQLQLSGQSGTWSRLPHRMFLLGGPALIVLAMSLPGTQIEGALSCHLPHPLLHL